MDLMFKDEYEFYVFDTAPTANARRLLGMSKVYSLWVEKMLKSRKEAKSHMAEIWENFGDGVRAILPLFETEVKGAKMLNRTMERLFSG